MSAPIDRAKKALRRLNGYRYILGFGFVYETLHAIIEELERRQIDSE